MILINDFLDAVLYDFKLYINSGENLCKLLDTHFDGGKIPNYSDINIQQLYLLRYAYAYAFEYKYMYKSLIRSQPYQNMIEVTSIGCGSMIDYWSLSRVIEDRCMINYNGIDTINWNYKFYEKPKDSISFYCMDVTDYLHSRGITSDIYIFPKSISELSLEKVKQIADCFCKDNISKDRFHLMFSLRTDEKNMSLDAHKTEILCDKLLDNGFNTKDRINKYSCFSNDIKNKNIHSIDIDFKLPCAVIDFIKELYSFCPDFYQCINSDTCRNKLSRYPILKCKYSAWQVFFF